MIKKLILIGLFLVLFSNTANADLQFTDGFGHNLQVQTPQAGNIQFNYFFPTTNMTVNDTMNPRLDNVSNLSIYATAVTIHFDTDEQVSYDVYLDGITRSESTLTYSPFNIVIEGLHENTNYIWNVTVCDFWGNCNSSDILNFTTLVSAGSGGGGIEEVTTTTTTTLLIEEVIEEDFIDNVEEFLEDITTPLSETARTRLLNAFNTLKIKYKSLIIISFFGFLFILGYDRKKKKFKFWTSIVLSLLLSLVYYDTSKIFIEKWGRWLPGHEIFAGCIVLSLILFGFIYLFKKAKSKTKKDPETKQRKLSKNSLTVLKIVLASVLVILIYPSISPLFTNLGKNLSVSILTIIGIIYLVFAIKILTGKNEGKIRNLKKTSLNLLKISTLTVFGILIYPYLVTIPTLKWFLIITSVIIFMTIRNKLKKFKDTDAKKIYINKKILQIVKVLIVVIAAWLFVKYFGNLFPSLFTFIKEQPLKLISGLVLVYIAYNFIKKQTRKKKSEF